jgi:hypothetical protein
MGLVVRIYFNAVFGALGGLLGWLLYGIFGDKSAVTGVQLLLGGALIGGLIGYFVVSVEAMRDQSLIRFARTAAYGAVLGAAGGSLGLWFGDWINFHLVQNLLGAGALRSVGEVFARGLGWMFLGAAVGVAEGLAFRSLGKLSYGTVGGAIGGLVGGGLYGLIKALEKGSEGSGHVFFGALGLVILGACIGGFAALVQGVFQPACLRVLRGWQEGREYPLLKSDHLLGRDEAADIPLFRDMKIEKTHAVIQRQGNSFFFLNHDAPPDQTRINDQPIPDRRELRDGDRIQLGGVVLRFQMRAAKQREKMNALTKT